jgi:hypothetical protein
MKTKDKLIDLLLNIMLKIIKLFMSDGFVPIETKIDAAISINKILRNALQDVIKK